MPNVEEHKKQLALSGTSRASGSVRSLLRTCVSSSGAVGLVMDLDSDMERVESGDPLS